ncbi:MAG: hypothetical protein GYB21_09655 [Oceanospirillales bacterium]|nr:hypothetical protein [Oceanospirillales bacterium]
MTDLIESANRIFEDLASGEVALAYDRYPTFINAFVSTLDSDTLTAFQPLLGEMLRAQEMQNTVWLADLIRYVLIPELEALHTVRR